MHVFGLTRFISHCATTSCLRSDIVRTMRRKYFSSAFRAAPCDAVSGYDKGAVIPEMTAESAWKTIQELWVKVVYGKADI